jgi:hypothetical protein
MKFLCLACDEQMHFETRDEPGDGTFAAAFACPKCGRAVAMLANPMETKLVSSLGVEIGGRTLDPEPMEFVRSRVAGREDALQEDGAAASRSARPGWSGDAERRLDRIPAFVRGMVKKIYGEYAVERGIDEITPEVMDRARTDLGLEGM